MRKSVLVCDKCGVEKDVSPETVANWYKVSMTITCDDVDESKDERVTHHLCGGCTDDAIIPFRELCEKPTLPSNKED